MINASKGLRRRSYPPTGEEIAESAIGGEPTVGGDGVTQVTPGSHPDGENSQFSETASVDALRKTLRKRNNVGQTTQARQIALAERFTEGLRTPTPDRHAHV